VADRRRRYGSAWWESGLAEHWGRLFGRPDRFKLAKPLSWADSGHEVAWSQLVLKPAAKAAPIPAPNSPILVEDGALGLTLSGDGFRYRFDRVHGLLEQIELAGSPLLKAGPKLDLWRAPIDNDQERQRWRELGLDRLTHRLDGFTASQEQDGYVVKIDTRLAAPSYARGFACSYTYRLDSLGRLSLHVAVKPEGDWGNSLPRVGVRLSLVDRLDQVRWYGLGPGESYPDSHQAVRLGLWSATVDQLEARYVFPQENGNRSDVRWVSFTGVDGSGLLVRAQDRLNFGAHRCTPEDLDGAKHLYQIPRRDEIVVNLDYRQNGLGTASCGPGPLPQYILKPEPYEFTFEFMPVTAQSKKLSSTGEDRD
jgi:beta-galactosidase/evolved beta-galactosidase subunit alpha